MREDTKRILKQFEVKTIFNEKKIKNAESQVRDDENILYIAPSNATIRTGRQKKKLPGILVITDKRVFFYSKVLFIVSTESFNLKDLNSIESSSTGISGSYITLNTNTKSMDVLISHKRKVAHEIIQLLDTAMDNAKNKFQSGSNQTDNIEQIAKLAKLKEQGILSEQEFEKKKQELLNKI